MILFKIILYLWLLFINIFEICGVMILIKVIILIKLIIVDVIKVIIIFDKNLNFFILIFKEVVEFLLVNNKL